MSKRVPKYLKFKMFLIENGITQREVAELLGITESTLSMKIWGKMEFTLEQVVKICDFYGISADKFFSSKSIEKETVTAV